MRDRHLKFHEDRDNLPLHIGADSWIGLITIIAIGLAIAAGVYVAARHYSREN